jgi:hypothetical protein
MRLRIVLKVLLLATAFVPKVAAQNGAPFVNVEAYGCKADGTTDNATCIYHALSAAQINNSAVYFPASTTGSTYKVSIGSGFLLNRSTRIVCAPGVVINWAQTTGTLFTFGNDEDRGWLPGGVENCALQGNAAGNTSAAVQIGVTSGSNTSHGVSLIRVSITAFGNGVIATGNAASNNGDDFAWVIDTSRIFNNLCNGIRIDNPSVIGFETATIINSIIANNGNNQANCTGIQASPNSGGSLRIISSHFDGPNGNGAIGQIFAPSTGYFALFLSNNHFEHSGCAFSTACDAIHIQLLSTGGNHSSIMASENEFVENPATVVGKPIIQISATDVYLQGNRFTQKVAGTIVPIIDLGASVGGQGLTLTARNNLFACAGTAANCQVIAITGTPSQISYDITGSVLSNFGSAIHPTNVSSTSTGCHDLLVPANALTLTGSRICTGKMAIGGETISASPRMVWDVAIPISLTSTNTAATWTPDKAITVTRMQVQVLTPPSLCSPNAVIQLTDGINPKTVTVTAAVNDSGAVTQDFAAGTPLIVGVSTAAAGCSANPANAVITVQYRMQ